MKNREVTLTLRQVSRFQVVQSALEGRHTNAQAAGALSLSVRQVQRLKRRVEREGPAGVIHGNKGHPPANKTDPQVKERILQLAEGPYEEYNFSHLADTLEDDHGLTISDETLRLWLRPLGHGGKPYRRKKKHYLRRKRRDREGKMLFLDGSPHRWFGEDHGPTCLLLSSDDATGKPLWGKFQPQENRDGCFEVCYQLFKRFGLPGAFYLDRGSQFTTTRRGGSRYEVKSDQEDTHFERAMKDLGVALIFANSPQARGRGERLNGSFQGRLVNELKLHGIENCEEATRYLNRTFIPRYAKRFAVEPADPEPAWRPLAEGLDLRSVLCAKFERTVGNDNTISFQGVAYQLYPPKTVHHLAKAKVEVQQHFDGSLRIVHPRYGVIQSKRFSL